jgi:microcystin degradation protein MlrC
MRIAVANLFHLSNTFNRKPTEWQRWSCTRQLAAPAISRLQPATTALVQSMNQAAGDAKSTIVPIIEAVAPAGGPLAREARDSLLSEFSQRLQEHATKVDALILVLSGCMTDEGGDSVDTAVLREARASLSPEQPIVAVWSSLANLSEETIEPCDLCLSYDLRDPEDAGRVGRKAIDLVHRLSHSGSRPRRALRKLPLLLPPGMWRPDTEPVRTIQALAHDFEAQAGVLDVSIIAGFPFIDHPDAGLSLVVTADAELELATGLATRLRTAVWTNRDTFFTEPVNVEMAVHEAMQSTDGPIIIMDAGDDPALGAASEGTGLLWALIDLGARNAALAAIVDPEAVATAIAAGVGSTLTFDLGGKFDRSAGYPVAVTAGVRRIIGASGAGFGRAVRLDVEGRHGGSVEVVVCDQPVEPTPVLFEALGIDLATKQIVAVKSSWRVRETFSRVASRVIETTTPGITTPVLSFFDYQRIPRPIYPLDAV